MSSLHHKSLTLYGHNETQEYDSLSHAQFSSTLVWIFKHLLWHHLHLIWQQIKIHLWYLHTPNMRSTFTPQQSHNHWRSPVISFLLPPFSFPTNPSSKPNFHKNQFMIDPWRRRKPRMFSNPFAGFKLKVDTKSDFRLNFAIPLTSCC